MSWNWVGCLQSSLWRISQECLYGRSVSLYKITFTKQLPLNVKFDFCLLAWWHEMEPVCIATGVSWIWRTKYKMSSSFSFEVDILWTLRSYRVEEMEILINKWTWNIWRFPWLGVILIFFRRELLSLLSVFVEKQNQWVWALEGKQK